MVVQVGVLVGVGVRGGQLLQEVVECVTHTAGCLHDDWGDWMIAILVALVSFCKVNGYARCDVCLVTRLNGFRRGAGYHNIKVVGFRGSGERDV